MSQEYIPSLHFKIQKTPLGVGHLIIHQAWKGDELLEELFTLESLAHCLDMPMSTMNGRYQRARLMNWMRPVMTGSGRPIRAFPMAMLEEVQSVILTRNATVSSDAAGSGIGKVKPAKVTGELEPTYKNNRKYYRIESLAKAFGLSPSTIRKRLIAFGLMSKFETIGDSWGGGRPKRGLPETYLGDVKRAIENGIHFKPALDRRTQPEYKRAQEEMEAHIAPHTPPRRLQLYDEETRAPAKPPAPKDDSWIDQIMEDMGLADIDLTPVDAKPLIPTVHDAANAPPPFRVFNPDGIEVVPVSTVNAVNEVATADDPHTISRQAWEFFSANFIAQDEVDQEELQAAIEQMELDTGAAERFKHEIEMGRKAK